MEMDCACKGSVAMQWVEEHGNGLCMQGFSGGIISGVISTGRICAKSLRSCKSRCVGEWRNPKTLAGRAF